MIKDDLRSAAEAITRGGFDNDVISTSEGNLTDRKARQSRQRQERDREGYDTSDYEADRNYDDDEYEDEDFEAESSSNRRPGEPEDDEGDEGDDDQDGNEDVADESDEPAEAEKRGQSQDDDELHEVTVQGEKFKVTTRELRDGYQRSQDYHAKTMDLAGRRRALEASHNKVAEHYADKLTRNEAVVKVIRNMLAGDINSREMHELRSTDPQRWSFERQNIQDKIDAIDNIINQVNQEQERHRRDTLQRQQDESKQFVGQELEHLQRHVPDWGERKVKVARALHDDYGFSPDEINLVQDSRMLRVASDAQKWREFQAAKSAAKDKRKAKSKNSPPARSGRPQKGGIGRKGSTPARKAAQDYSRAKASARKSGTMRDAAKAIGYIVD